MGIGLIEPLVVGGAAVVLLLVFFAGLLVGRRQRKAPDAQVQETTAPPVTPLRPVELKPLPQPPPRPTARPEAPAEAPPEAPEPALAETTEAPAPAPSAEAEAPTPAEAEAPAPAPQAEVEAPAKAPKLRASERFRIRLSRVRSGLGLRAIFRRGVDEAAWEQLEESLIAADVGVEATLELVDGLRRRAKAEGISTGDDALNLLKEVLRLELSIADRTLHRREAGTSVWLFTGVNGTGKTTSIGKLAARHRDQGETVVLAAADTFRAAAAEQLELWGQRAGARVVRHQQGADPAAVAFDGYASARATGADLLLVDTAGRLQNKRELMEELSKVKRVLERDAGPCDEVLLVLDATTGQNGLAQAQAFLEAVSVTGVVLTKLDGTAKGGIVIAIQRQLGLPVKLVGLGESIDDLADFDPDAFVEALFADVAQDVDLEDVDLEDAARDDVDREAGDSGPQEL